MISEASVPEPYRVEYSVRVRQRLLALADIARQRGDGTQFIAAVKEFDRRLRIYPQFGGPLVDLKKESGHIRIGIVRNQLDAAGFDFDRPDRKPACRVLLKCGWEPVACERTFLYYEARDDGIELGRWFQHGQQPGSARHERVAVRFSSPKLRACEFESSMGLCAGPDDARTFAKMLSEVFTSGPDQIVSRWKVELRRYEPS